MIEISCDLCGCKNFTLVSEECVGTYGICVRCKNPIEFNKPKSPDAHKDWKLAQQGLVNPVKNPRYDQVYKDGMKWLDKS